MYRSGTQKFYKNVELEATDTGFSILLDGRPVKSPAGAALSVRSEPLARRISEEWAGQEDTIHPSTMPMTALSCTMIDRIVPQKAETASQLLRFAETDMLCYRAQEPTDLVSRQQKLWQPMIDWLAETHHVQLVVTEGILPVKQPQSALDALSATIDRLQDWELAALSSVTAAAGSLVIGLALIAGRIDEAEAFAMVQLDEDYQNERWGTDEEAARRQQALQGEIQSVATFVDLARA